RPSRGLKNNEETMNDTKISPALNVAPDFAGLIDRLKGRVPAHCILSKAEDTRPYECDGLSLYRSLPPVVIRPEIEGQVVAVLQACKAFKIPFVARGAGTGLSGGAMPHAQGVLVGLAKLNQIRKIDLDTATAVVQPGVRNLAISEAAVPYGLYFAPDPSSQIA